MKLSNVNDYLQFAASVGVMIGLGLVVYEIRENNAIAYQQAVSNNWQNWTELGAAEIESNVSEIIAKSMSNPEEVSLAEMVHLNFWLSAQMTAWEQDLATLRLAGDSLSGVIEELIDEVPLLFGNRLTRGWYLENKYWLSPEYVQAIDRELESLPLGSDLELYERIMDRQ